ncbi:hypothetical protein WJX77_004503 [Trebouxia sp. C0004]
MYLMYYDDAEGNRVYTMLKTAPDGSATQSAHPARFSPDDKFSRERLTCKKRQVSTSPEGVRKRRQSAGQQPLEDLGNALVSMFPVEMQYNIRGSCRNARRAVHGVMQAVCTNFQKLLPRQEQ